MILMGKIFNFCWVTLKENEINENTKDVFRNNPTSLRCHLSQNISLTKCYLTGKDIVFLYSMGNSQFIIDLNVKEKTGTLLEVTSKCFIDPKIGRIFSFKSKP